MKKCCKKFFEYRVLCLFLLLSWTGCAHQQAAPHLSGSANHPLQEATVETESIATASANGSEFADDIFADEFEEDTVTIPDPLSPVNRAMYYVNDKLYFWILKPIARGYTAITPELFRIGVKNFFRNVTTPIRVANCILQGKANAAAVEFSRFLYNTVVGVLGFASPADKHPELAAPDAEDFGQTLGVYGFTNGIYIVWPVFGPSTLRDSIGMVGDWFLDPVNYLETTELSYAVKGFDRINETSFRIGEYEALKKASLDPYVALRDVYLQYREKKTKH